MDAKITKQRLGNLLSYDWLKILLAIVAAIAGLCVLFTMVRTRPTTAQEYKVFAFGPLQYGENTNRFYTDLDSLFSYEILETGQEKINYDSTGIQTLMARRTTSEGTVVFAPDYAAKEGAQTAFNYLCSWGIDNAGEEDETMRLFLDLDTYFDKCEAYIAQFFDGDWASEDATIDMDVVRETFLKRNKKDKRFRSAAKKDEGVLLEKARIEKLREDYLAVRGEICEEGEDGKLPIVRYTHSILNEDDEEIGTGKSYAVGINLSKLGGVKKLYYYVDAENNQSVEKLNLLLFDNGESTAYTRYETVTLLRHLLDKYAS